jgi:hypothetical protein
MSYWLWLNGWIRQAEARSGKLEARSCLFVEEGLEDEDGGDLVDDAAVLLAGVAGLIEDLVGFAGGEALVPEVDGKAGERAEFGGKCLIYGGLWTDVTGEVEGVSDDDADDGKAAGETGEGAEVVAGDAAAGALALEGEDGLGGEAEFVRDGNADAAVADIEAEKTRGWDGFQGIAPNAGAGWGLRGASRVHRNLIWHPIQ